MVMVHSPSAHTQPVAETPVVGSNKRRTPALEAIIGASLKAIREQQGLSQAALGRRVGLTHQAVQKLESAHSRLSLSTAITLCRAMGVHVADLLDGIADPRPETTSVVLTKTGVDGTPRITRYDTVHATEIQVIAALSRDIQGGDHVA